MIFLIEIHDCAYKTEIQNEIKKKVAQTVEVKGEKSTSQ